MARFDPLVLSDDVNPVDRDAIGKLYEDTGFLVFRRCMRMLGDHHQAMDATQWTYLRALEVGLEVRTRPETLRWLYQTATNRCRWVIRNRSNRSRIRGQHREELAGSPSPSPESAAIDRDLLQRTIASVDDRTAEIALLTWAQGLSNQRAAEICQVSLRTVARARSAFEDALRRLSGDEVA